MKRNPARRAWTGLLAVVLGLTTAAVWGPTTASAADEAAVSVTVEVCEASSTAYGWCADDAPLGELHWAATGYGTSTTALWRYTIANTGAVALEDFSISDSLATTCTPASPIGELAPGAATSWVCSAALSAGQINSVQVDADPVDGGASVSSSGSATYQTRNEPRLAALVEVCTQSAGCDEAAANGAGGWSATGTVPPGGDATWRITFENYGTRAVSEVSVSAPNATACQDAPTGMGGAGTQYRWVCQSTDITQDLVNEVQIDGTALVPPRPYNVVASGSASVTVVYAPAIAVAKEICTTGTACDAEAALGEGGWGESAIPTSGSVQWRIVVTNTGDAALSGVTLTDEAAPACETITGIDLAVGASATASCLVTGVDEAYTNTAIVAGEAVDGSEVSASDTAVVEAEATTVDPAPTATSTPSTAPVVVEPKSDQARELPHTGAASGAPAMVVGALAMGALALSLRRRQN